MGGGGGQGVRFGRIQRITCGEHVLLFPQAGPNPPALYIYVSLSPVEHVIDNYGDGNDVGALQHLLN